MAPRATCVSVMLALIAVALIASVEADLYQECLSAFNKLGSKDDIAKRVPSCQLGFAAFGQCCDEAKQLLKLGPDNCLCDAGFWAEVERKVTEAGIDGLDVEAAKMFADLCGIRNFGSGTC